MIPQSKGHGPAVGPVFCYCGIVNFLAHLYLAGNDDDLRLGALLGDFVRGKAALETYSAGLARGIRLHRHIDAFTDTLEGFRYLRAGFEPPFRRYAGIIIDLGFDHALACRWNTFASQPLEDFDRDLRDLLARNQSLTPPGLKRFMAYADRRGLFAAYRQESEILHSLAGIGTRLSRPNPLDRTADIWAGFKPRLEEAFGPVFSAVQSEVGDWLKSRSTTTGS
jgi:acyl carrier protein phosphodiesterase